MIENLKGYNYYFKTNGKFMIILVLEWSIIYLKNLVSGTTTFVIHSSIIDFHLDLNYLTCFTVQKN